MNINSRLKTTRKFDEKKFTKRRKRFQSVLHTEKNLNSAEFHVLVKGIIGTIEIITFFEKKYECQ